MKTASLFFLSLIATIASFAQTDSTQIDITLKVKHHGFLVGFMPDKSGKDFIRYMNQVSEQVQFDPITKRPKDTAQMVTVTVATRFVENLYFEIGCQDERLTASNNREIQALLMDQLKKRPKLLQNIGAITMNSANETDQKVNEGFEFLFTIKQ
jgi:hypothetical protein